MEPGVGEELAPGEASSQVVGEVTEHRGEGEKLSLIHISYSVAGVCRENRCA